MDSREKVLKIIKDNLYMTIAVSGNNGDPWIANIYFVTDKDTNFYWYSSKETLHSKKIDENPRVAISIFNSTAVGDDVDAVYVEAKAKEVKSKTELIKSLILYSGKMLRTKFANKALIERFVKQYKDFQGLSKLRIYKATPTKIFKLAPSKMFNDKFIDSRIEVKL